MGDSREVGSNCAWTNRAMLSCCRICFSFGFNRNLQPFFVSFSCPIQKSHIVNRRLLPVSICLFGQTVGLVFDAGIFRQQMGSKFFQDQMS